MRAPLQAGEPSLQAHAGGALMRPAEPRGARGCRYLEGSACVGTCVNMCKIPTETFFTESFGLPLYMKVREGRCVCRGTPACAKARDVQATLRAIRLAAECEKRGAAAAAAAAAGPGTGRVGGRLALDVMCWDLQRFAFCLVLCDWLCWLMRACGRSPTSRTCLVK